jgi:hypothetical protein
MGYDMLKASTKIKSWTPEGGSIEGAELMRAAMEEDE